MALTTIVLCEVPHCNVLLNETFKKGLLRERERERERENMNCFIVVNLIKAQKRHFFYQLQR